MGLLSKIFSNTRKPKGFGRMMVNGMNGGSHARMAEWGLEFVTIDDTANALDVGCGGGANIARRRRPYPQGYHRRLLRPLAQGRLQHSIWREHRTGVEHRGAELAQQLPARPRQRTGARRRLYLRSRAAANPNVRRQAEYLNNHYM